MNDPLIARFADACGSTAPLDLRVDLAGGGVLAEGSVAQPFTLVGRDDACDVTLSDPEINPRHVWLQVIGGRVFAADLGSRTGLLWPGGARGPGWLDVGTPARIGPFLLRLRAPAADRPSHYPPDSNPLASGSAAKDRPSVALEFKNGRRAKDRWQVNRLLTLIGRAADCKIHLTADDISHYHCGLVSTPTGLWVVDLSGRGVVVNGERMRVAPLPHGTELWVGRFLIGCQQTPAPNTAPTPRPAAPPSGGRFSPAEVPPGSRPTPATPGEARIEINPSPAPPPHPAPTPLIDDEVELGAAPGDDPLTGSHIMSDAFRQWEPAASGSMSNPILVSGSGPKPPAFPFPPGPALPGLLDDSTATGAGDDWSVVPLLRQMADLHSRTVAEFQQALALVVHAFGRVRRDHLSVLQHELTRIQDLTAEIVDLQCEVAQQALERAATDRARQVAATDAAKPTEPRSRSWVPPSARTPLPDPPLAPRPTPDAPPLTPSAFARAADRLVALQQERAARWQALIALFSGT